MTKNKETLDKYIKIIDQMKEEILLFVDDFDEDEDTEFIMGRYFMKFLFKTDYNLPYYEKINVKVCVVSISSLIKKGNWYYPQLQDCFY